MGVCPRGRGGDLSQIPMKFYDPELTETYSAGELLEFFLEAKQKQEKAAQRMAEIKEAIDDLVRERGRLHEDVCHESSVRHHHAIGLELVQRMGELPDDQRAKIAEILG